MKLLYSRIIRGVNVNKAEPFLVDNTVSKRPERIHEPGSGVKEENRGSESPENEAGNIIKNAGVKADSIIEEAKVKAQQIIENAKREAEKMRQDAYNSGYEEGYSKGTEECKRNYQEKIEEAEQVRALAEKEYYNTIQSIESDIVYLSMSIAKKVVEYELSINPDIILNLIKNAIKKTSGRKGILVEVSSDDFVKVVEGINSTLKREAGISEVEVNENPGMSRGDFEINTNMGSINGMIDTKFEKIEKALEETRHYENYNEEEKMS